MQEQRTPSANGLGLRTLISSKSIHEESEESYYLRVSAMYEERKSAKPKAEKPPKPAPIAPGLKVTLLKSGALSVTRNKKTRAFAYVLRTEINALATALTKPMAELWNTFLKKEYVILNTQEEADKMIKVWRNDEPAQENHKRTS